MFAWLSANSPILPENGWIRMAYWQFKSIDLQYLWYSSVFTSANQPRRKRRKINYYLVQDKKSLKGEANGSIRSNSKSQKHSPVFIKTNSERGTRTNSRLWTMGTDRYESATVEVCGGYWWIHENQNSEYYRLRQIHRGCSGVYRCILRKYQVLSFFPDQGNSRIFENILLGATSLGVGSCWVAGDKKPYAEEVAKLLSMPGKYKLIALIALGYSDQKPQGRRKSLEGMLYWERYRE